MSFTGILHSLSQLAFTEKNVDKEEEEEDKVGDEANVPEDENAASKESDDAASEGTELSKDQYEGEEDEEVGNYYLVSYIGSGSYGVVWKATHKDDDDKITALKISRKDELSDREIRMLKKVGNEHPNIVHLYDSFLFDDERRYVMVMNLMQTNLYKYMRKFNRKQIHAPLAKVITRQLLSSLEHLANVSVVHTDIKPENILIDDTGDVIRVQLADFGSACHVDSKDECSYGKTVAYRSPEVLCQSYRCMRPAADTWSMACVIFEIFSGAVLFDPNESNCYSARGTGSASTSPEMNKQQLSLMVELLGKFPRRFAKDNRQYFNRLGHLKDVGEIPQIDMRAILMIERELDDELSTDLYAFLKGMLMYTPRLRSKPSDLLQSEFLKIM